MVQRVEKPHELKIIFLGNQTWRFWEKQRFSPWKLFVPHTEYTAVNKFCWNIRDEINILFENNISEKKLSKKEKCALNILIKNRNVKIWVNDTDKNLGPISADKDDAIKECQREFYDIFSYNTKSLEEAKNLSKA